MMMDSEIKDFNESEKFYTLDMEKVSHLGDMSYWRQVDRCCRIDSIVWRGCCLKLLILISRCFFDLGSTCLERNLPGNSKVLLKGSWEWRKNSLCRLIRGECLLPTSSVLLPHPSNVGERLLCSRQQPCATFSHFSFVLVLFVIPFIVWTVSPAFAGLAHHCWVAVIGTAVNVIHLVAGSPLPSLGARQRLQIRVVDRELDVVLLKHMSSRPLNGQAAKWECCWLTVRTSDHLDTILGGEVPQLKEEDCEVVDKEQGVNEGEGKLDNVLVCNLCSVF